MSPRETEQDECTNLSRQSKTSNIKDDDGKNVTKSEAKLEQNKITIPSHNATLLLLLINRVAQCIRPQRNCLIDQGQASDKQICDIEQYINSSLSYQNIFFYFCGYSNEMIYLEIMFLRYQFQPSWQKLIAASRYVESTRIKLSGPDSIA